MGSLVTASNILICGSYLDTNNNNIYKAYIANFDYNGNLIWRRNFYKRNSENNLLSINSLPNNFFLAGGFVLQDDTNNTDDEWFIVIDEYGCDTANCSIGISENKPRTKNDILIFPNPVNNLLHISLPEFKNQEKIMTIIIDISGRIVYRHETANIKTQIDLTALAPGMYTLIINNNGYHYAKKILKQ